MADSAQAPNYFTCTLGQAAALPTPRDGQPASFSTILDLIESQARLRPQRPALGFAKVPSREDAASERPLHSDPSQAQCLTFSDLCDLSHHAAAVLSGTVKVRAEGDEPLTIGLLSSSNMDFVLTLFGLLRLGHRAFLLAPQLDAAGLQHICQVSGIGTIFVDDRSRSRLAGVFDDVKAMPIPDYWAGRPQEPVQCSSKTPDSSDTAYFLHTSGTSSGKPKPIAQSHWGAVGVVPRFAEPSDSATFTTTPLYHGGLADAFRAWAAGAAIWFFSEGQVPLTSNNIMKALEQAQTASQGAIRYFSSVPYILQLLSESAEGVRALQGMDLVGVGGAALAHAIGDELVRSKVRLVSRMGSAECGFLMSSYREFEKDPDWHYLRPIAADDMLSFEGREAGLAELVVKPKWPLRMKTNRPDGSFATADLFEPHPSLPNVWKYHSRADGQIALTNGKKFDPAPIEAAIVASTNVRDVLIFGAGQDYPGILLFVAPDRLEDAEAAWVAIDKINRESPAHARLFRSSAVTVPVSGEDPPLPKSSKGTILRAQAEEKYEAHTRRAYAQDGAEVVSLAAGDLEGAVQRAFDEALGRPIDPERDLYDQGIDSIACVQVRRAIERVLPKALSPLPANALYDKGSIKGLTDYLAARHRGTEDESPETPAANLRLMEHLTEKYSKFGPAAASSAAGERAETILLTGATGSLGSHVLSALLSTPSVRRVYCLVRADSEGEGRARLLASMGERRLIAPKDLEETGRLACVKCNLSKPNLGLDSATLEHLAREVTSIIHSAWPVNFTLHLQSFEPHLAATKVLVDLARQARAGMHFISSTAATINSAPNPIPEAVSFDPRDASQMGYGQSKWVAERICAAAFTQCPATESHGVAASASIIRVGQLCGNRHGVWNRTEAIPLMMSSVRLTRHLPRLPNDSLNWLPVDKAADAIVEIVLSATQQHVTGKSAGGLPPSSAAMPVYHVLNPHKSPTWQQMAECVQNYPQFELDGLVEPRQWLEELAAALEHKAPEHPSRYLLDFWRRQFSQEGPEPHRINAFDLTATTLVSSTIARLSPLDEQAIKNLWDWVTAST